MSAAQALVGPAAGYVDYDKKKVELKLVEAKAENARKERQDTYWMLTDLVIGGDAVLAGELDDE